MFLLPDRQYSKAKILLKPFLKKECKRYMKKRKRKRFYKNVKRNQTWTEEIQGREIDFADKYADDGIYSDKFDYLRPKKKPKNKRKSLERKSKDIQSNWLYFNRNCNSFCRLCGNGCLYDPSQNAGIG